MASPRDASIVSIDLPTGIARKPSKTRNFLPVSIQRAARDRMADEKNRQAEAKEDEYWRSIVPSSCALGLAEMPLYEVYDQIQRRVKREVKYLCLLPVEEFSEPNVGDESSQPKRYMEWMRCAVNVVSASLNLDSPNPIGWDAYEDSFVLSRLQNGEIAPSYWILGAYCRVRGAQPWQATRSYIACKVYELLEAEGWEHWITSQARWDALAATAKPVITKHLQNLNKVFNLSDNSSLCEVYSLKIWNKFVDDHMKALPARSAALAPLYTLTESYVKLVGAKLELCGELQASLLSSERKPTNMAASKMKLEASVMKRVKKLQYEYFPLIRGGESALEKVRDKVLERFHTMFNVVNLEDASSSKVIASILNDLEDQHAYLSTLNGLSQVRVCFSDIVDHSIASIDGSSFLLGSRSSANNESDSKAKRMRVSRDDKATDCGSASLDSSIGHSEKLSKGSKTASATANQALHQHESAAPYAPLTLTELKETNCGNCILCAMPNCDRCFSCVENQENSPKENKKELKCCIRRLCCKIPTQLKSQPAIELGLPKNWRFSFDDPERSNLISFNSIVAPVGLKIISPNGKQFYSLQSAFAHIEHSSALNAIQLLEAVLKGFGSLQYESCPTHFLVGKNYCIDYMTSTGSRVTLFGEIIGCMKSNSAPDPEVATDENTFFILQYSQDALDPNMQLAPFHLISAVTAWGGCIAFERKTTCRPNGKTVIARIDQATPVETWVAPDVQWDEMVAQPNGTMLPQFTLVVRGYKFVFRAKESKLQDGRTQYGLFASCIPLKSGSNIGEEINFRPGEMVDLGVCSPLRKSDSKELSVFIAKNYIHSLKCGRWGFLGSDDSMMHDITDDASGDLHELASTRGLSYIRKWNEDDQSPTIHARLDPDGNVHCLLGIPYQGNWSKYESDMRQFAPLFNGQEMELTISHSHIQGNNKRSTETKHLQVIRMFQLEDIVPCFNFLIGLIPNAAAAKALDPKVRRRSLRVIHCLDIRAQELSDASREIPQNNDVHSSLISSTLLKLQAMKQMLEEIQN